MAPLALFVALSATAAALPGAASGGLTVNLQLYDPESVAIPQRLAGKAA